MKVTNNDIFKKLESIEERVINTEKHAIATNGSVTTNSKSIALIWKFIFAIIVGLIGIVGTVIGSRII